jgi:hypothetical protein
MFEARRKDEVTILRGKGALSRGELVAMAAVAARARKEGRRVIVDLRRVTCFPPAAPTREQVLSDIRGAAPRRLARSA